MKIAIVTDDGRSVSGHFGRARSYAVLTVEDGAIVARELRPKFAPHLLGDPEPEHPAGVPHGVDPASQLRHDQMADTIADCQALIAGGMGQGAYERFRALGIRPIVTALPDVDAAALACAAGTLVDHTERLH
jgi:predicted Fe-Mo cluster-binding NifX family protein